ncbi:hypothetical protein BDD12DRAFT_755158, partial [Trichophaea hybrida]
VKDVQSFVGFTNFYRRFISRFSTICYRLTELTIKRHEEGQLGFVIAVSAILWEEIRKHDLEATLLS